MQLTNINTQEMFILKEFNFWKTKTKKKEDELGVWFGEMHLFHKMCANDFFFSFPCIQSPDFQVYVIEILKYL